MKNSDRIGVVVGRGTRVLGGLVCLALVGGCPSKPAATGGATPTPAGGSPEATPPASTPEPRVAESTSEAAADARYALDFTVNTIEGRPEPLTAYRGKVVMVVNVASACGMTPQYAGLQALYQSKSESGLVILGFPANNFGGQEPGTNQEIQEFCTGEYNVSFPMFEKISVTGEDQHPLYQRLSQEGGPPSWNFTKYLVDRQGRVVARFDPRTAPDNAALVAKIDELLAE